METLLVHSNVADLILPPLAAIYEQKGVELRGCAATRDILPEAIPATEEDWRTEYLAPILSIKLVDDLDAAIDHINTYGSHHTDAIITENYSKARRFFARGGFGLGDGERQHAFLPMGSSTAWAPRSAFPPTRSTHVVRSAWKA